MCRATGRMRVPFRKPSSRQTAAFFRRFADPTSPLGCGFASAHRIPVLSKGLAVERDARAGLRLEGPNGPASEPACPASPKRSDSEQEGTESREAAASTRKRPDLGGRQGGEEGRGDARGRFVVIRDRWKADYASADEVSSALTPSVPSLAPVQALPASARPAASEDAGGPRVRPSPLLAVCQVLFASARAWRPVPGRHDVTKNAPAGVSRRGRHEAARGAV